MCPEKVAAEIRDKNIYFGLWDFGRVEGALINSNITWPDGLDLPKLHVGLSGTTTTYHIHTVNGQFGKNVSFASCSTSNYCDHCIFWLVNRSPVALWTFCMVSGPYLFNNKTSNMPNQNQLGTT